MRSAKLGRGVLRVRPRIVLEKPDKNFYKIFLSEKIEKNFRKDFPGKKNPAKKFLIRRKPAKIKMIEPPGGFRLPEVSQCGDNWRVRFYEL
nr:hypothetical protein [uncultured Methanoregula sp.]